jgi:anti-sigma-K factor RskA
MNEIHALSGAYAVDALDDLERARFEQHLAQCADCRAEVAGLRETAAMLGETTATEPSAATRAAVLSRIGQVRPLPPEVSREVSSGSVRRIRRWPATFVAAAVTVLVLGALALTLQPWRTDNGAPRSLPDRILAASDATRSTVSLPVGGSATMINSRKLGRAMIMTRSLGAAPAGKVYELWLQNEKGEMIPAGLLGSGHDQTVVLEGSSEKSVGGGITVEPSGGSRRPTSEPIALFTFRNA